MSADKKKEKPRNGVVAGIIKRGADWFFRKRIVAPKKGHGAKRRPRNSNRKNRERGKEYE